MFVHNVELTSVYAVITGVSPVSVNAEDTKS